MLGGEEYFLLCAVLVQKLSCLVQVFSTALVARDISMLSVSVFGQTALRIDHCRGH